jgi:hypothetical protein
MENDIVPSLSSEFNTAQQGTYDQLNQLFTNQDEQKRAIQEARDILGESAKDLTDDQVNDLVKEMQFLVDSWLEEFERQTFDGKTLNELLGLHP